MKKVKLGIIGVGNMGFGHIKGIIAQADCEIEVTAIADRIDSKLEAVKKHILDHNEKNPENAVSLPATFKEGSELIASGTCEAILIAVPHYDHPVLAIEAFKAGLHVLCEKPAGVYTLQVREMMAEADKHPELKFGMMFNQRTNCLFRKMKEIIDSGELGEIRRTNWIITDWYRPQAYYDSGDWRATWSGEGGGVLLNQCPHNLDLWQWICGMPVYVDAKMSFGRLHDVEIEDEVTAFVRYANGATGTFITTTGEAPGANRFEIVCDGGTIVCDDGKLILKKLDVPESEFTKTNKVAFAAPKCVRSIVETDGQNLQHRAVRDAFAAAILRDEPMIADGREGINGLMISNAMHLSAWTGKPVELPFDEQLFKDLLMEHVKNSRRKVSSGNASAVADLSDTYGSKASK
jgi:predicted dehydrogenase